MIGGKTNNRFGLLTSKGFNRSASASVERDTLIQLPSNSQKDHGKREKYSSAESASSLSKSSSITTIALSKQPGGVNVNAHTTLDSTNLKGKYGSVRHASNLAKLQPNISCTSSPADCEAVRLPENLESIPRAEYFPTQRHRWNTNEEIASLLINFDKHNDWLSKEVKIRPKSGSMLLYSRKKVRYRRDGYCWKKRKDGKTTREDHMKLKVQGIECIYGCYVHSAILPTFHRRCYWLLQNPDIVLVHYLNVPYPDDNKLVMASSISLWADKKEWTKEELISQLKPMFFSEEEPDLNNDLEISTAETVEAIVGQLMEKQRAARASSAKNPQSECACGAVGDHAKQCSFHPIRKLTIAKLPPAHHSASTHQSIQPQHQETVCTSRPAIVTLTATTESSVNQVSPSTATLGVRPPRFKGVTQEGIDSSSPSLTPSPVSPSINSGKVNDSNDANNNVNNIHSNTAATPLILNLSNVQGGGSLLILNSSASNHSTTVHGTHHLATTPFTLTSYFGQPQTITTNSNSHHQPTETAIINTNHAHQLGSGPNGHHHVGLHHHVPQSSNGHRGSDMLIKREIDVDKEMIDDLKLDVTNGNLSMVSGTFANLVSSLDEEPHRQNNVRSHHRLNADPNMKGTFFAVKTEVPDMPIQKEPLFRDAIQLSSEDIQKTLSANLPRNSKNSTSANVHAMDFIDNNMTATEDDVLANLDAFDMLSDFADLDHYDTSPADNLNSNNSDSSISSAISFSGKSVANQSQQTARSDFREASASITDYSPEWAYPEGGIKVLVTGPWYNGNSPYTVLFDSSPTTTTLVQPGVLRCYCPAHQAGLVTLQVACDGFVISNSVIFEYKKPPIEDNSNERELLHQDDEHLLKFTLLQRLQTLETRPECDSQQSPGNYDNDVMMHRAANFEDRVLLYWQKISPRTWQTSSKQQCPLFRGQTLLHLAARLGLSKLIDYLLRWKEKKLSKAFTEEVDPECKDDYGRTPLSWACRQGHQDCALSLFKCNSSVLKLIDKDGVSPIIHARRQGHLNLVNAIMRRQNDFSKTVVLSEKVRSLSTDVDECATIPPAVLFLRPTSRRGDLLKDRQLSVDFAFGGDGDARQSCNEIMKRNRIVKRPSVDSAINLVGMESFKRASLDSGLDVLQKHSRNAYGTADTRLRVGRYCDSLSSPMCYEMNPSDISDQINESFTGEEADCTGSSNCLSSRDSIGRDIAPIPDDSRVFTLAEQIIAAIPERIKGDEEDVTDLLSSCSPSSDLDMQLILDDAPQPPTEFNFELSDPMSYRYMDVSTPSSSVSAASSCLPSPASFTLDSPSPPPTTADLSEFFHASTGDFSRDFSNLTLSDEEQRELYEAAKIIQKAYRLYKGRLKQQAEQDKERQAAVLIQNYYRRYKQYAYHRQMSRAATLIQNQFRSYCESKRFKKTQENCSFSSRSSREGTPVTNLKRTFSQRRQHQAARKIQQFMRQTKQKLQKERAQALESEKCCPTAQVFGQISSQTSLVHLPPSVPQSTVRELQAINIHPQVRSRSLLGRADHSSEPSRRVSDPLLSTTAHLFHRTD